MRQAAAKGASVSKYLSAGHQVSRREAGNIYSAESTRQHADIEYALSSEISLENCRWVPIKRMLELALSPVFFNLFNESALPNEVCTAYAIDKNVQN